MREVEPELGLILDKSEDFENRSWTMNQKKTEKSDKKDDAQGDSKNG